MASFKEVDPNEVALRKREYGHFSEKLVTDFMNAGIAMAKVTELEKPMSQIRPPLQAYITRKKLPIELFQSGDKLYMKRTDDLNKHLCTRKAAE